jgi:hypothetical protein
MLAALAATRSQAMTTRTTSKIVTFARPFTLKGVDRILPPGEYRVVTDEELIEELSFPVYRRMATMIFVPADSHRASSVEMVTIDPLDLKEAQDRDAEIPGFFCAVARRCRRLERLAQSPRVTNWTTGTPE